MSTFKSVKIFLLTIGLVILFMIAAASTDNSPVKFAENPMRIIQEENTVSVYLGDSPLMRYRYEDVPFKPYVKQLFSAQGINILRDAPADHLHHHGLMFAVAVDNLNFWEEKPPAGRQQHQCFTNIATAEHNDVPYATFTELIHWQNPQSGQLLLIEKRTIEICQAPIGKGSQPNKSGVTLLTWKAEFQPPSGKDCSTLTGKPYFGLGIRFLKAMDIAGLFRNADGKMGVESTNGMRASWCAYSAKADGKPVTVAMFDHPLNHRYPATWFTMDEPFVYLSLTMNLHNEPLKVTSDKPLTVQYGVAVWDGQVDIERIEQLYQWWLTHQKFIAIRTDEIQAMHFTQEQ